MVGVNINYKLIFSLLALVLILSVSAVSADDLSDDNSILMDDNEISALNGVMDDIVGDDEEGCSTDDSGTDNPIADNSAGDGGDDSGDANAEDGDDEGGDDTEEPVLKNTTLTILSPDNWKI